MQEETSNVVQLFPDPTDAQYEELILPILVQVVGRISKDVDDGQVELLEKISGSMLCYVVL